MLSVSGIYRNVLRFVFFGPRKVLLQKIAATRAVKCQFIQQKLLSTTWAHDSLMLGSFLVKVCAIRWNRMATEGRPYTQTEYGSPFMGFAFPSPWGGLGKGFRVREGRYLYINVVHLSGAMTSAATCWICSAVTASTFS